MARNGTRRELTSAVIQRKESLWGSGDRPYNPQRAARNVRNQPGGGQPSIALLKWAANASDDELILAVSNQDPDYAFLFYK
jgi:hypothetical protein